MTSVIREPVFPALWSERCRLLWAIKDRLAPPAPAGTAALTAPLLSLARAAEQLVDEMLEEHAGDAPDLAIDDGTPLATVVRAFGLRDVERDALLLAVLAEIDWSFGRLLAYLQDHPGLTRPTVGLALAVSGDRSATLFDLCGGPLVRDGILAVDGDGPRPGRTLRATDGVAERLAGARTGAAPRLTTPPADLLATLVLDDAAPRIRAWASAPDRNERPLLLVGPPGSGRRTVGRAAAGLVGAALVTIEVGAAAETARLARRDARWHDASVLLEAFDNPRGRDAWLELWRGLAPLAHPLIVALPPDQVEDACAAWSGTAVVVHLGAPGPDERRRLWRALAPAATSDADVDALAVRFAFGPGRIARVVASARAEAGAAPPPDVLTRAARASGRDAMGPLAERLVAPYTRADLVVTERVHAELDLATAWLRHGRRVQADWGLGDRIGRGRGLTALFAGEPGTGKTMAAQVLAHELDLDLYRIDLSRVLNKYIGETEKNLARLFDEAAGSGAILFFDEGDALFGKRTETKDAHDRYANVEIAYLLQRMEQHEGVTVVATNRLRDIDEAFVRRFHVLADFSLPETADRLEIWKRMLAPPVVCDGALRLDIVAREFQLSGGQIRNAALAAAYLAAADDQPIGTHHLERALRRELKRQGRVFDERVSRALGALPGRR